MTLLGDSAITHRPSGAAVMLPTQKAFALFAYLTIQRQRVPRNKLANLLWADVPQEQARHSLRQALFEIRRAADPYDPDLVSGDRWFVAVNHRRVRVDVHRFETLVARHTPRTLRHACAVYRGDLLPGLLTREHVFDSWLLLERLRLRQLASTAHADELRFLLAAADYRQATATALALIKLQPHDEWAHRTLAGIYAELGEFHKAVVHLQGYLELLAQEGRTPEPATERLLDDLSTGAARPTSTTAADTQPKNPAGPRRDSAPDES